MKKMSSSREEQNQNYQSASHAVVLCETLSGDMDVCVQGQDGKGIFLLWTVVKEF